MLATCISMVHELLIPVRHAELSCLRLNLKKWYSFIRKSTKCCSYSVMTSEDDQLWIRRRHQMTGGHLEMNNGIEGILIESVTRGISSTRTTAYNFVNLFKSSDNDTASFTAPLSCEHLSE